MIDEKKRQSKTQHEMYKIYLGSFYKNVHNDILTYRKPEWNGSWVEVGTYNRANLVRIIMQKNLMTILRQKDLKVLLTQA